MLRRVILRPFDLENGIDGLYRNVGRLLSIYAAYYPRRAKISPCCSVFSVYIIISNYIYGLNARQTWTCTL